MRIEWAVDCNDVRRTSNGYDVFGIAENGRIIEEHELPIEFELPVLVCFRVDVGDVADAVCDFQYRVERSDGAELVRRGGSVQWRPGSSPKLVEPERYYVPIKVDFTVAEGGLYTIEISDVTQVVQIPLWFSVLRD